VTSSAQAVVEAPAATAPVEPAKVADPAPASSSAPAVTAAPAAPAAVSSDSSDVYAGPSVRLLARELGVDLGQVAGTGPRSRIQKDDVNNFVKSALKSGGNTGSGSGAGIPQVPAVDFSQFGEIETVKLSKIQKITADNMQRNWLNVPHVTQFDDADITELEVFRKSLKLEGEKKGIKVTPVAFIIKAAAAALAANPEFNRSLAGDGENYVQKHYINIGMAVDTPRGLVVPVIKDADKKGIWEISADVIAMATLAREGKLKPSDMQGGCFTISSLGAIGGNGFTPIVNSPEVGILGVSKSQMKPIWDGSDFQPKLMLPLALSYDHRVINGGDAGRFMTYLVKVLSDIRHMTL
jgi:pyruvate dehydrogenase E2 component (dihydrolipoamide acetyltransferase)